MLAELFDNVPTDLVAYFEQISDGSLSGHDELELNLLPVADALRWTKDFREFHPVVNCLRGFILDDPNTSNHHIYLSAKCCAGAVFHLSHDSESPIVFPSLSAYAAAAREAIRMEQSLTTYHQDTGIELSDQAGLSQLVADLLDGRFDCEGAEIILALIPSMDLTDLALLERLARIDDFYIAEAVGDAIARRPRKELKEIAETCKQHPHFQAAKAGSLAVAAIVALQ